MPPSTRRTPLPALVCYLSAAVALVVGALAGGTFGVAAAIPAAAALWALGQICEDVARIADAIVSDAAPPDAS